jgi:hypothetical protein
MNSEEIGKFAQSLRGTLIGRDHADYDASSTTPRSTNGRC